MEEIKNEILRRHYLSMLKYLRDNEREKGAHVTDFVYGCPRYAKWIYDARMSGVLDDRNLSQRDMTVFAIGKKLDELEVGDYHHVPLLLKLSGITILGEIDDLIIEEDKVVVVDKKHLRGKPPREAHSHYMAQVNIYAFSLLNKAVRPDYEKASEILRKLEGFKKYYGAILYIDVSLETSIISDVVVWEITPETFGEVRKNLTEMAREWKKDVPKAVPSWFCGYCPFFSRCIEVRW